MIAKAVPVKQQRILFIANGNGEDSIAAAIIAKLPASSIAEAYPFVGHGNAYKGLCPIVGPRSHVPSEGWRHTSGSVTRDIKGGMFQSVLPAVRFLKSCRRRYDRIVAVGDIVTPVLCAAAGLPIDIYLDVFKSGFAHRYSLPERWLLRRATCKIYCRDDMLAKALRQGGIDALSAGNIMLDTVPGGTYDMAGKRQRETAITLLPGSRDWTAESLAVQVAALAKLPHELVPDIFVAVAAGIDSADLAHATGTKFTPPVTNEAADLGSLAGQGLTLHLATGVLGNLIAGSDLVLSQAGTATQQALGMGKPVITFNRADNRPKRMADEQALMGEARILVAPNADALTEAMVPLLRDGDERLRLGATGRQRLGGPGTLAAVLADLAG